MISKNTIGILILTLFAMFSGAQKIYYSPGNESWEQELPDPASELLYSVFLIGDINYTEEDSEVLKLFKRSVRSGGAQSAVVVVGDVIYPLGMPDSTDETYPAAVDHITAILNTMEGYEGKKIIFPGNHDWVRGREGGWEAVQNQEAFVERYLNEGNVFLPDGGCPGPVEVALSDDITLIVFDSQWWFHKHEKPMPSDCDYEDIDDIFVAIEDAIRRNQGKKVIFAAHHPLFSVGHHGGHFPESYLLFPLLEFKNWLYLPLPGFLYTGFRKYLGHIQDIPHPEYKIFKAALLDIFSKYPNVIFAAGHEHNLQFIEKDSLHHIISGGGGEGTYIARRKKKADFAADQKGFSTLYFYANGDVWLDFVTPDGSDSGEVLFRKRLFKQEVFDAEKYENQLANTDFSDSTVDIRLTDLYKRGGFTRFLMGNNYRYIWNMEVTLPVFDIRSEKGGLSILKRGGGQQTRSIRMEAKDGRQYVLRSVNKYVGGSLDEALQGTLAEGAVQDAISASHPFGALSIPYMAEAAGVMHTNPKMVWVPDDPNLGIYRRDMANNAFLFEERPSGDWSGTDVFKGSEKIISTDKLISKTQEEHDHKVDQKSVVNARLFDMLIGDWDRHDDQWRWASFKNDGITTYEPIPRDRDQAFFINEGVVMAMVGWDFIMPKFKGFDRKIRSPRGLGFNARYFDRSFMTEPDLEDWRLTAESIRSRISDSVIHYAVAAFPPETYELHGKEIEESLKRRRDALPEFTENFYLFLSRNVDVVGTEKRDLFEVNRIDNEQTDVKVFALSKKKGKKKEILYHRVFKRGETKEIRLYGLEGKDQFILDGEVNKGLRIRIIGGKSNDSIINNSRVKGPVKKTIVYDRKDKKNFISRTADTKLRLSHNKSVNTYNRKQFKYNRTMPLLAAGYNIDDGILIGGGVSNKRYNFRDSTFHRITGKFAFRTLAFMVSYSGLWSGFSRYYNLLLDADVSMPRNVDFFYGLGNNTEKETNDNKYYRVRYSYAWVNPRLSHKINESMDYSFGAFYQYFKVTDTSDRFIGGLNPDILDSTAYLGQHFTGINAALNIDTRDNELFPVRGITWFSKATGFYSLKDYGNNFLRFNSDLSLYLSARKDPRVVFALRAGGAMNFGNYEFFHANFLGHKSNLRGFRRNRFAGDHSFYQNTEIRFKVLNLRSYVFNGQTGFLLFNDIGRVWVKGEESKRWHHGFGAGIWLIPFDMVILTATYEHSKEEELFTFNFRFLF